MAVGVDWGDVATWASTVTMALTLVVIWWQLKDVRRSIQGATYQSISATMIEIDRYFADHPDVRPYFYGEQTLGDIDAEERERLYAIAEMVTDFFYEVFHQTDLMPAGACGPYIEWMKQLYKSSPLLQEFVPTGTYDVAFVNHLKGLPNPLRSVRAQTKWMALHARDWERCLRSIVIPAILRGLRMLGASKVSLEEAVARLDPPRPGVPRG